MAQVCFYFQLHQPYRLRRYSVFDTEPNYFDEFRNGEILRRVCERCYRPASKLLLDLIRKHDQTFRLSFSLSGVLVEQLREHAPDVIENFLALAETGCVEFLNETYHHSLAFLYSRDEFREQVELHSRLMEELFGQTPRSFRNTELIYNNDLAHFVGGMQRYEAVLAEGADQVLAGRPPTEVYRPPHTDEVKVMLKHYRLSDDVAFRFSNRSWPEWPLTAEKFAKWVTQAGDAAALVNLFLDFETFGEHQWAETGIFDFLAAVPQKILEAGDNAFLTVSEAAAQHEPTGEFDVPHMISWADTERDLSAWLGNAMQSNALHELYKLEQPIKRTGDEQLLADWRRLNSSDHFYYMCTKYFADGDVHKYFNPYESPYDSYINFMNVLDNLRSRAQAEGGSR
jgi:alpha-amylase